MKHTPEQREEWRALRKIKPVWRPLYGWRLVPIFRKSEIVITDAEPEITGYQKQFSHQPGAIFVGPPRGTNIEGACYIVYDDHTLRKITRQAFDLLAKVPPIARVPMLQGKKTLKEAA